MPGDIIEAFAGGICPDDLVPGWWFKPRRPRGSDMPRVPDHMLDGAVFLFPTRKDAENRARLGGSAFLISKPIEGSEEWSGVRGGIWVPYLVSNRHVVWGGGASVACVNRRDGRAPDIFEYEPTDWIVHPSGDDLAAICVVGDIRASIHKTSHMPYNYILPREAYKRLYIGVGDDVVMVGRFINHQGHQTNRASVRFGNVCMMAENIWVQTDNRWQESIAVEMRSRTGFSGSPVVVYRTGGNNLIRDVELPKCEGLLGVNWGFINENGESTWLNGVVPSWKLIELFECPEMKQRHQHETDIRRERVKQLGLDGAVQAFAGDAPDENPQHLEDFNRLLTAAARKQKQDD